jgi:hypothetical protein
VYAKAEWYNPGGSVKDRAALSMVLDGERTGRLTKDKILVDATSGNTGIAYAMVCAQRGYRVKLCVPQNASRERKQTLLAYGVDLVLTDPTEGTDGAQRAVKKLVAADPDKYFYPDQYNNDANWRAHYETTAWRSGGRPTAGSRTSSAAWDERHVHGRDPPAEGAEPRGPVRQHAAGRPAARAGGAEAHGVGHRPRHLQAGAWPTPRSRWPPRTRTGWSCGWRGRRLPRRRQQRGEHGGRHVGSPASTRTAWW